MAPSSNIPSESDATRMWFESALQEYEQIASLCNAQSLLINAVVALSPSSSAAAGNSVDVAHHDDGDYEESYNAIELDPKVLKRELQHRNLYDQLSKYYQEIDVVRKTHAAMKAQLMNLSNLHNSNVSKDDHPQQQHNNVSRSPSPMVEALTRHIELSERVIRTVMKSSSAGQCGILFENGILRTSSSSVSDHEVNVVALASLRASVSQLKANFGGDGNRSR
ncbi:hypothetical protein ACHAWU_004520 [Discostella pseudostelligera]|uniref:Uncharacterized protein n=1 Tax=Discostella pseudostelligera TaxID=259834 RepID=A0ABD3MTM6_9STRA